MSAEAITQVWVSPNYGSGHFIQWVLHPELRETGPFTFKVQYSEDFSFNSTIAEFEVKDQLWYVDNTHLKQHWGADFYVRVVMRTGSGSVYQSKPLAFEDTLATKTRYARAAEVMRLFLVQARYSGYPAKIFKRKTYGTPDLLNLDEATGVPMTDEAGGFGTGITGGYHPPLTAVIIPARGQQTKSMSPDGHGVQEDTMEQIKMLGFPRLDAHDLFYFPWNGSFYDAALPNTINFPATNIPILQKVDLTLIPNTDSVYKLLV